MPRAPSTTPGPRAAEPSIDPTTGPSVEHPVTAHGDDLVIPVVAEQIEVSSRPFETGAVRVRIEVDHQSQPVRAHNVVHTVAVRHVPRGIPVDEARPPWNDGDALVVPVYEERLVLERRLVLKEEIHIVRQTVRQPVERHMPVRSERAVVERQQPDGQWQPEPTASSPENAADRDTPEPRKDRTMRQTIVGVFDRYEEARKAADMLQSSGIAATDVQVTAASETSEYGASASVSADDEDQGLMARVRSFFAEVFGSADDDHADVHQYAEHVRRGGAVVKVDVADESRIDEVRDSLQSCGAVDIDERVEEWRQSGWTGDRAQTTLSPDTSATTGAPITARSDDRLGAEARKEGEEVIPVLREEVRVGKRAVAGGGVRVYTHTAERPVEETVRLREEHARVERRPVERELGAADARAFQDRTVEVSETSEEAVVQKRARVVEEVVVGKDVREREQKVRDTVRQTEVEVEPIKGRKSSTKAAAGIRPYTEYDSDFRSDFSTRYGSNGGRFEDYGPAYEYGHGLAADPRYTGRDWDSFEADARSDWERRYPDRPWERMKDAVRHAWQRVKS